MPNKLEWDFKKFTSFKDVFTSQDGLLIFFIILSFVLLFALIAAIVISFFVMRKKGTNAFTTKDLTYGAVCLAISFALSFIGLKLPQGGTITPASALPVMLYCYFFGFRKGSVVCFAYMLLQYFQDPYIVHPMSALLDYVIPYLSLMFLGLFSYRRFRVQGFEQKNFFLKNINFIIGAALYVVVRYACHILSGVIFYSEWAWEGWGVWAYSFAYNAFILIDTVIAVATGFAMLSSRTFSKFMLSSSNMQKAPVKETEIMSA